MKWIDKIIQKFVLKFLTKKIDGMKKSWKTTVIGIAVLLGAIASAAIALVDGDPTTTINISEIVAALVGIGFIASKDGDVTHSDNPTD